MCGLASPLGVRAHSTRGVASQALFKGSSLEDGRMVLSKHVYQDLVLM